MHQTPRKYGCLRAIGYAILIAAWIVLILGVGSAVTGWLAGARTFSGIQLAIIRVGSGLSLLFALALFFQWFVLGSVLTLMTDLERNTRRNAEAVDHLVALAEAPEKAMPTLPAAAVPAVLQQELPFPPPPSPPPVTPPSPPQPFTPTLEAKPVATTVAATAAVVGATTIEGPLPPPPPLAPSLVNEGQATVSTAAAEAGAAADAATAEVVDTAQTAVTAVVEETTIVASRTVVTIADAPAPEL